MNPNVNRVHTMIKCQRREARSRSCSARIAEAWCLKPMQHSWKDGMDVQRPEARERERGREESFEVQAVTFNENQLESSKAIASLKTPCVLRWERGNVQGLLHEIAIQHRPREESALTTQEVGDNR